MPMRSGRARRHSERIFFWLKIASTMRIVMFVLLALEDCEAG